MLAQGIIALVLWLVLKVQVSFSPQKSQAYSRKSQLFIYKARSRDQNGWDSVEKRFLNTFECTCADDAACFAFYSRIPDQSGKSSFSQTTLWPVYYQSF